VVVLVVFIRPSVGPGVMVIIGVVVVAVRLVELTNEVAVRLVELTSEVTVWLVELASEVTTAGMGTGPTGDAVKPPLTNTTRTAAYLPT
jgi:hypothetical protein